MLKRLYYWWMEVVLDRHVCKEFTQWHRNTEVWTARLVSKANKPWTYTKDVQERQCTICGKTQREEIC